MKKSGKVQGKEDLKELDALKNQLARALADYDNLRKRTEGERETWFKFAAERTTVKLLPIIDSLEAAQTHLKDQGLAIALGELKKVLIDEGLSEINPTEGEKFDPKMHEAIEVVEGREDGKVAELVLKGWKFGDEKVVRPAKVKVFKGKN